MSPPPARDDAWHVWLEHGAVVDRCLEKFRSLSPADREEVRSDAALDFIAAADQLESIRSVSGWIHQIVVNAARTHLRRRQLTQSRESHADLQDDLALQGPAPHEEAESEETARQIRHAIVALPDSYAAVAYARVVEQMSYAAIGTRFGISVLTARKRMQHARHRLATALPNGIFSAK